MSSSPYKRSNGRSITAEYDWEKSHGDTQARTRLFGQKALRFRRYFFEQSKRFKEDLRSAHDFHQRISLSTLLRMEIAAERRHRNQRSGAVAGLGRAVCGLVLQDASDASEVSGGDEDADADADEADSHDEDWETGEWTPAEVEAAVGQLLARIRTCPQRKTQRVATALLQKLMRRHDSAQLAMDRAMGILVSKVTNPLLHNHTASHARTQGLSAAKTRHMPPESLRILHLLGSLSWRMAERISSFGAAKKLSRQLCQKAVLAAGLLQAQWRFRRFRRQRLPGDARRNLRHLHLSAIAALRRDFASLRSLEANHVRSSEVHAQLQILHALVHPDASAFCHRDRRIFIANGAPWPLMHLALCASLRLRRLAAAALAQLCREAGQRRGLLACGVHRVAAMMAQSALIGDVELGVEILHALADGVEGEEGFCGREAFARELCERGRDGGVLRALLAWHQCGSAVMRSRILALLLKICQGEPRLLLGCGERPTLEELRVAQTVVLEEAWAAGRPVTSILEMYRCRRTCRFLRTLIGEAQAKESVEVEERARSVCALKVFCKLCASLEGREILRKCRIPELVIHTHMQDATPLQASRCVVMMLHVYEESEPSELGDGVHALDEAADEADLINLAHELLLRLTLPGHSARCLLQQFISRQDALLCCLRFTAAFMQSEMTLAHMTASSAFISKLTFFMHSSENPSKAKGQQRMVTATDTFDAEGENTNALLLTIASSCVEMAVRCEFPKGKEEEFTRLALSSAHSSYLALRKRVHPPDTLLSSSVFHPVVGRFLRGQESSLAPWLQPLSLLKGLQSVASRLKSEEDVQLAQAACSAALCFMGAVVVWRGAGEELFCDFEEQALEEKRFEAKKAWLVYPTTSKEIEGDPMQRMIRGATPELICALRSWQPRAVRCALLFVVGRFAITQGWAEWIFSCFHKEQRRNWFLYEEEVQGSRAVPRMLFTLAARMARTRHIRASLLESAVPAAAFATLKLKPNDIAMVGEIALLLARLANVTSSRFASIDQRLFRDEYPTLQLFVAALNTRDDLRVQLGVLVSMVQLCKDAVNAAVPLVSSGCIETLFVVLQLASRPGPGKEVLSTEAALVLQQALRLVYALLQYPSVLLSDTCLKKLGGRLDKVNRLVASSEADGAAEIRHLLNEVAELLELHKARATARKGEKAATLGRVDGEGSKSCATVRSPQLRPDLLWTRPPQKRKPRKTKRLPKIRSKPVPREEPDGLFVDPTFQH